LCRSANYAYDKRSKHVYVESLHRIKRNNRFICYSKPFSYYNLYGYRNFKRLHSNSTNNRYGNSFAGCDDSHTGTHMRRTIHHANSIRSRCLYMEPCYRIEQHHRVIGNGFALVYHNLYDNRKRHQRMHGNGTSYRYRKSGSYGNGITQHFALPGTKCKPYRIRQLHFLCMVACHRIKQHYRFQCDRYPNSHYYVYRYRNK
jgi:hypothetical protein